MTAASGVALVTGAAGGVGRLAAQRLAAAGVTVVAVDSDAIGLERTARRAPQIRPDVLDVRDADAVEELVARTEATLGPLERLVHTAGAVSAAGLLSRPRDELLGAMEIAYGGFVATIGAVVPRMVARDRGEVVVVTAAAGWWPTPHLGAASAPAAAVAAATEILALELAATSVRVVCVCGPRVEAPMPDGSAGQGPLPGELSPVPAEVVLDAAEQALDAGRVLALPGRWTTVRWRLRGLAPELVRRRAATAGRVPRAARGRRRWPTSARW